MFRDAKKNTDTKKVVHMIDLKKLPANRKKELDDLKQQILLAGEVQKETDSEAASRALAIKLEAEDNARLNAYQSWLQPESKVTADKSIQWKMQIQPTLDMLPMSQTEKDRLITMYCKAEYMLDRLALIPSDEQQEVVVKAISMKEYVNEEIAKIKSMQNKKPSLLQGP